MYEALRDQLGEKQSQFTVMIEQLLNLKEKTQTDIDGNSPHVCAA